ncbi:210_t:CDS:2, partial [Cetraspora pellucida]
MTTSLVFEAPIILQSNNGKEFIADIIFELIAFWPDTHIINRHLRHPQLQEITEGLPLIIYTMNIQTNYATGKLPYSLVFGQELVQHFSILEDLYYKSITNKEELPEIFFENS